MPYRISNSPHHRIAVSPINGRFDRWKEPVTLGILELSRGLEGEIRRALCRWWYRWERHRVGWECGFERKCWIYRFWNYWVSHFQLSWLSLRRKFHVSKVLGKHWKKYQRMILLDVYPPVDEWTDHDENRVESEITEWTFWNSDGSPYFKKVLKSVTFLSKTSENSDSGSKFWSIDHLRRVLCMYP